METLLQINKCIHKQRVVIIIAIAFRAEKTQKVTDPLLLLQWSRRCRRLLELYPLDLDLALHQLVDVGDDGGALDIHEDEGGHGRLVAERGEGAGGRARVDVEAPVLLVGLELVRVAGDQDVAVQLTVDHGKG